MDRAASTAPLQTDIGEISQEMPQGKMIKSSCQTPKTNLSYWKISLNILYMKTQKNLMGHATFNIEKDTVLTSQSQQQSLFTSN